MKLRDHLASEEEIPMSARMVYCNSGHQELHIQNLCEEIHAASALKYSDDTVLIYGNEYDAISGQKLPADLVAQGRALEMEFLEKWRVYDWATYAECTTATGKRPIKTKWVQTNKGNDKPKHLL